MLYKSAPNQVRDKLATEVTLKYFRWSQNKKPTSKEVGCIFSPSLGNMGINNGNAQP